VFPFFFFLWVVVYGGLCVVFRFEGLGARMLRCPNNTAAFVSSSGTHTALCCSWDLLYATTASLFVLHATRFKPCGTN